MSRKEFLDILKIQLTGQIPEGRAAAHLRYYEDYMQSQIRKGRSEQEVLEELGDPHLIAKTLIDTNSSAGGDFYEDAPEYSSDASYTYDGFEEETPKKKSFILDLSTWYGKLGVIAVFIFIIFLLMKIFILVVPFFLIMGLFIFIATAFKKR